MTSIVSYQKVTDDFTTHQLLEPDYAEGDERCTELCTIAGVTYVAVPDTATLPADQPAEIAVQAVTLDNALRDQIKAASPHVALINRRVVEKIREKYSMDDEFQLGWQGTGTDVDAFRIYVATCVAEGQEGKLALGLG